MDQRSILFAWLGDTDLRASESRTQGRGELGPIADAVCSRRPSQAVVVSAQEPQATQSYKSWLRGLAGGTAVDVRQTAVRGPWDFGLIYRESTTAVEDQTGKDGITASLTFHLSPGTGAMSASWIILSKTRFPAELIESSRRDPVTGRHPIRTVNLPFDLSIELIGDLLRGPADHLVRLSQALPPAHVEFSKIIHKSRAMEDVIVKARRVAMFGEVPVLLLGESGTGKELLAKAIHTASPRGAKPFKAVNCGAIPHTLLESELFGHIRGSFTGASKDRKGIFEQASGGTVFLDEVGELPLPAQVALLRVLQEKVVTPVGGDREVSVDVRILAATNRDLLMNANGDGSFRNDLLHRLAVAIIRVPALRERIEDIDCLVDHFLKTTLDDLMQRLPSDVETVRFSPSARRRLREHDWPGNVRELQNTLVRATVWSSGKSISENEVSDALLTSPKSNGSVLDHSLGEGFDLNVFLKGVRGRYVERALRMANGNQTRAAKLLGVTRQAFGNWSNESGETLARKVKPR